MIYTVFREAAFLQTVSGVWSCATAEFIVRREIMHHVLQSYVPTALIVVISWFSFWLDVDAVPGRVSLSITTLLTLATQASAARLALPQVGWCANLVVCEAVDITPMRALPRSGPY